MARLRLIVVWVIVVWGAAAPSWAAKVSDWVDGVGMAANAAGVLMPGSEAREVFDKARQTLADANVLNDEITAFVWRYASPDKVALARRSQQKFLADVSPAVQAIKDVYLLLTPATRPAGLRDIVLELQLAETTISMEWDAEVLRRLERKYGPGSAKLNGAEVLLSYGLQGTRGFGIDRTTGYPGPLEPVFAYSVAYLTHSDDSARVVSVAELGLRSYLFGKQWGGTGRLGALIRPRYISGGLAVSGESDQPLSSPFQGTARYGAFFGWGELKVAYLAGDNQRLLFTQQIQIIPWVF